MAEFENGEHKTRKELHIPVLRFNFDVLGRSVSGRDDKHACVTSHSVVLFFPSASRPVSRAAVQNLIISATP